MPGDSQPGVYFMRVVIVSAGGLVTKFHRFSQTSPTLFFP